MLTRLANEAVSASSRKSSFNYTSSYLSVNSGRVEMSYLVGRGLFSRCWEREQRQAFSFGAQKPSARTSKRSSNICIGISSKEKRNRKT